MQRMLPEIRLTCVRSLVENSDHLAYASHLCIRFKVRSYLIKTTKQLTGERSGYCPFSDEEINTTTTSPPPFLTPDTFRI